RVGIRRVGIRGGGVGGKLGAHPRQAAWCRDRRLEGAGDVLVERQVVVCRQVGERDDHLAPRLNRDFEPGRLVLSIEALIDGGRRRRRAQRVQQGGGGPRVVVFCIARATRGGLDRQRAPRRIIGTGGPAVRTRGLEV